MHRYLRQNYLWICAAHPSPSSLAFLPRREHKKRCIQLFCFPSLKYVVYTRPYKCNLYLIIFCSFTIVNLTKCLLCLALYLSFYYYRIPKWGMDTCLYFLFVSLLCFIMRMFKAKWPTDMLGPSLAFLPRRDNKRPWIQLLRFLSLKYGVDSSLLT